MGFVGLVKRDGERKAAGAELPLAYRGEREYFASVTEESA
jgi:hypothetical protein